MDPTGPAAGPGGGRPPLNVDLNAVDPRRLDVLDRRRGAPAGMGGVIDSSTSFTPPRGASVTPVPQRGGDVANNFSNLTDSGGGGGSSLAATFEKADNANDDEGNASNASCRTVKHDNLREGGREVATIFRPTVAAAAAMTATTTMGSKKKSRPLKRPVSAIGDRHATPPPNRGKKGEPTATGKRQRIKQAEETKPPEVADVTAESSLDAAQKQPGAALKHPATPTPDQNSTRVGADQNSQSRDTLHAYFPNSSASNSNHGSNSNHASRSNVLSSPPTLQSKAGTHKEKGGNQPTLHSFLGIKDGKNDKKQRGEEDEGRGGDGRSGDSAKEGAGGENAAATSAAASSGSSSKPPLTGTKNKRASLRGSCHAGDAAPSDQLNEVRRLQSQLSSLQRQLDDANARNSSIRNNQTLIAANLQRQLKHQKAELQSVRSEHAARVGRAMDAMERLVRDDAVRGAKELRQRLASDGARLGRLVTSRVAGGLGGIGGRTIESWEDGHAPRALKARRSELKMRREGLERRGRELATTPRLGRDGGAAGETNDDSLQSGDTLLGNADSSQTTDSGAMMNELDWTEARETVRLRLDEVRREEAALDAEERAMNIEKRGHVRALKRVSNEDASKFRGRQKLHDRYVLLNLLGRGGFSEVWRAFDLLETRHVAVKVHQLEPSWSDAKKENYTKHVSREYEIHREVRHHRIVSLYDVFEIDADSFATVLECCEGTDLDTLLKDRGRLPERDARAILLQVLSGMRYLSTPSADGRRQGIIHYDLKPGNILFDERGDAKITDFGLSKIVDTSPEEGESMELTSQGAGTYWYLPPECFLLDQDVRISNKVDVWSIGVIYFQMLFGRRPFGDGQSQDHILRNQTMLHATEVHFPSGPPISEKGKEFIRDCLTYDQTSRPNMSQICEHSYLKLTTTL